MPKTIKHNNLGSLSTPPDIRNFRKSNFEFHEDLGFPVVHKHKWNEKDLREGLVEQCPLHDDVYGQDTSWDAVCFGTGFVGGWGEAIIVYVAISDAPTDTFKLTPQGLLIQDTHPMMTAPWIPEMGDGDLIINVTFDPNTWDILDEAERFELREVTPVRMRGPGYARKQRNYRGEPLRVGQQSSIDKLPYGHKFYNVPIDFNLLNVPPDVTPPDEDPNLPSPFAGIYSEFDTPLRIRGKAADLTSSTERVIRLAVLTGVYSTTQQDIRITGKPTGVIFNFQGKVVPAPAPPNISITTRRYSIDTLTTITDSLVRQVNPPKIYMRNLTDTGANIS